MALAVQHVPKLISVALDPEGSDNQRDAATRDIVAKAEAKKKYVMVCGVKSTRGAPFGDGAFASGGRPDGASKKSS